MDRIYPTPTIFVDDSEPDLNAENLNKITNGLSALDKRVAVDLLSTNLAVTEAGEKAADATVSKVLNDKITQVNSVLGKIIWGSSNIIQVRFDTIPSTRSMYIDLYDTSSTFFRVQFNGSANTISYYRYTPTDGLVNIFSK